VTLAIQEQWPGVTGLVPRQLLGGGGGGTVWGCVDGDTRVAVKVAQDSPRIAREIEAQRRVGAVAPKIFRRTNSHDGRVAIVMEWLAGETLAARLAAHGGRWPADDLARLIAALAARIDDAHAAGIAHRDLKPENIWLEPDGTIRLLDFGLALVEARAAAVAEQTWATRGDVIGTPLYMAPEQAMGEPSDAAADIYSFGAILFELVAGRPPFEGAGVRVAHASRRAPSLSSVAPAAATLDDVIAACLAKHPSQRPRSAGAVAREVVARLASASTPTSTATPRRAAQTAEVALLGISSATDLRAVSDATITAGGMIARARADGFVIAFPGLAAADGVARATELAAALAASATIHVAALEVSRGARGVRVTGRAIDDADTWWRIRGITPDAAIHVRTLANAPSTIPTPRTALVGRDAEVAAIVTLARAAAAARESAVVTIVGEAGTGTTRLLEEALAQLASLDITVVAAAHRRDAAALDALEAAGGIVLAAAHPVLYRLRPLWGDRAARSLRVDLAPLDRPTTITLLRALLAPIEYIAEPVLAALADLADGNPGHAVEVVRQLHTVGAIRHTSGGGAYLAADELSQVSSTELAKQLASRVLARLAPDVRRYAQIAAILDAQLDPARLVALREAVGDTIEIDGGVALARLAAEQIVELHDGNYHIRHALLGTAIVDTMSPVERAALHRAALACAADLAARARHALGCGEAALAGTAFLALGDEHRAARRDVDAERAYTSALDHLAGEPRARALFGRGVVRCRLQRLSDADADLAIAETLVDGDLRGEVRLERATVADWAERWDDAATLVASVDATVALQAKLEMARGRTAFRAGDFEAARHALETAATTGDDETVTIARLLLGAVLPSLGFLDGAREALDAAIAACKASGDRLHHCAALNNRMWIWIKRDALELGIRDQRAATCLARELGHATLERMSTYNLAELLLWRGSPDEALPFALRSRVLQTRFQEASPFDALLVARIQVARDMLDEVACELAWVDASGAQLAGVYAMQRRVLELAAMGSVDRGAWATAIAMARETNVLYELPEALWLATRTARRAGDDDAARGWIAEGRALGLTTWNERFDALDRRGTR
jgi:eukaryotic-like serine/threonine-protein kinase